MRLGAYETEAQLGAGGMSLVWLARGPAGLVVLKRQLNPADDERLREEARVGMRLRHPGVVQTLDLFEHEGRPILVLEYVAGASLVALRNHGALSPAAVCSIGADVAEALAALHGAKGADGRPMRVLHRDVSPANVIVTPEGQARLIDLGIARAPESVERTQTGDLRGTVRYLAPELFDAKPHSAQTDLWALGVCLFESALGRAAVSGPEAVILAAVVRGSLFDLRPGEALPPTLDGVIKALCAPIERRVEGAAAAARLLREAAHALGDGRRAAARAVCALVQPEALEDPTGNQTGPAAITDENAFVRYAATTYCGTSDDVLLLTDQLDELDALDGAPTAVATPRLMSPAQTAVTPAVSPAAPTSSFAPAPVTAVSQPFPASPRSAPPAPVVPAAASVPAADNESRPFARSPRSSPGALEATDGSWEIPRPNTNPGDTVPQRPSLQSEPASLEVPARLAEPPRSVTAPSPPATDDAMAAAEADDLAELRGGSMNGWLVAAALLAALAIVVALVLFSR